MSSRSRHSRRTLPTQRSARAFAFGACTGVRITAIPSLRIVRTEVAEIETPRPRSSPTIRRYPQDGFSRASRTTSACTRRSSGGRPGGLCGYVQRRLTSCRCQRSSVAGRTDKPDQALRGSARASAARSARSTGRTGARRGCRRRIASSCRTKGFQAPSNAPICTAARPTAAAGRVPDRPTTSPRTTSGVGEVRSHRPTSCLPSWANCSPPIPPTPICAASSRPPTRMTPTRPSTAA
jgi:hypothetical protein